MTLWVRNLEVAFTQCPPFFECLIWDVSDTEFTHTGHQDSATAVGFVLVHAPQPILQDFLAGVFLFVACAYIYIYILIYIKLYLYIYIFV